MIQALLMAEGHAGTQCCAQRISFTIRKILQALTKRTHFYLLLYSERISSVKFAVRILSDKQKKTMRQSIVKTDVPSMCAPDEGPELFQRCGIKH